MTSIHKEPNGRYRARYRDPGGKSRSKTFDRKSDAASFLANTKVRADRGDYLDPALSKVTIAEWATQWLDGQVQLKPATRNRYESILRTHILPRWGGTPLAKVTHADVVTWVSRLSGGAQKGIATAQRAQSPASVHQIHRVFSLLLALAVRDGRLSRNPADRVPLPRKPQAQPRFLTAEQVEQLIEACDDSYRLFVALLAYSGLRIGEASALRVRDLNFMRKRLTVSASVTEVGGRAVFTTPKTHQVREVALPGFIVEALAQHVAGREPGDLVFTSPEGHVIRNNNFRRRAFDPAVKAIGLDYFTPHDLRHTAASLAISAGANVKAVQRMLGHASAAMTLDVYAGLFGDDLDTVAARLNATRAAAVSSAGRGPHAEVISLPLSEAR